ncbi:hypothetical protein PF008_g15681 [Phytophthora fragariae]|uniref:MYND-type domain-containing protein n=1 Tax=Phytophthora fragariae TaxID=53985 RepID=A0A6G0REQ4_9STRA|nr:hypothetical protein PF008_g15681 [Phytophthora fragariae]
MEKNQQQQQQQATGEGPVGIAPCEHCGQPSHKRCSRCKAFSVCRQACMVAVWPKHQPDCDSVVNARKQINRRTLDVYDKYGVKEPPGRGSTMDVDKKLDFFLEMLKVHDLSSPENKDLTQSEKMLMNCCFNNTYRHAAGTFTASEFDTLKALMHAHQVGVSNQPPK